MTTKTQGNGAVAHKGRVTKVVPPVPVDHSKLTTQDVRTAITLGRCDADLEEVLAACFARVKAHGGELEWRFEFRGMTLQKRDFTMGDHRLAQKIAGKFYSQFNAIHDADTQVALLAVALHRHAGMSLEVAVATMEAASPEEVDKAFSIVAAAPPEQPPFDGPSTPPSSA